MADELEIAKIITLTRKIESLLEKKFDAQGKGLHQKVSSIENNLDVDIVKPIRYLATIRNKAMHEDDFAINNFSRYEQTANRVIKELEAFKIIKKYSRDSRSSGGYSYNPSSKKKGFLNRLVLFILLVFGVYVYLQENKSNVVETKSLCIIHKKNL
ncbi:MAG: hypothetical protein Q9M36_10185 [Sulfurovum sp.]|nr:hypothetical protein [Sulfurovum sp.]